MAIPKKLTHYALKFATWCSSRTVYSMREIVTVLYERNLFYQQLNFRWRSYVHLRRLLARLHGRPDTGFCRKTSLTVLFYLVFLLDFSLGAVLVLVLLGRSHVRLWITKWISVYTLTMLQWIGELITWLMGVPGGLKLNTPLANFLGTRMLLIVNLWNYFYSDFIALYLSTILSGILLLSPFWVTLSISALHDFLKFLNLCSICFFIVTGRVLSLQVSALKSLARLFMGKKWNILRERIDSYDYDNSQLLVGTILFTILLFLLPTTAMYFLIFLLLRIAQFGVQLILRLMTVAVNRLTLMAWNKILYFIEDQPLTSLKVSANFVESHMTKDTNRYRECDCIRNNRAELSLTWNGREYSVEEVKALIAATPVDEILNEVSEYQGHPRRRGRKQTSTFDHPMLEFLGSLKIWPK